MTTIVKYFQIFLRRTKNKKGLYAFKSIPSGWAKSKKPIIGGDAEGSFFDPCVVKVGNLFNMYVSRRSDGSIVLFESANGFDWFYKGIALSGAKDDCWCKRVNRPCVLYKNDTFFMWFTGQNSKYESSIGYATSNDGVHFTKHDHLIVKSELPFEGKSVMNPVVRFCEKDNMFKMWYSSGDSYEPDLICYAESKNGVTWIKKNDGPVLRPGIFKWDNMKVSVGDVIVFKDKFIMLYIGYSNVDTARICVAESFDGLNWIKNSNGPLISPTKRSWDAHSCYKPTIYIERDKWFIWYNGRKKRIESIGLVTNFHQKERDGY